MKTARVVMVEDVVEFIVCVVCLPFILAAMPFILLREALTSWHKSAKRRACAETQAGEENADKPDKGVRC